MGVFLKYCVMLAALLWIPVIISSIFCGEEPNSNDGVKRSGRIIGLIDENDREIEELDLEDFLSCLVAKQVAVDSNYEYIKLYTVIMRTYIEKCMGDNKKTSTKELEMPYISYKEMEKIWGDNYSKNVRLYRNAVEDTSRQKIQYNGEIIFPYYHGAATGGTRDGSEVSKATALPYLKGVTSNDEECERYIGEKYKNEIYISKKDFCEKLSDYKESIVISEKNPLEVVSIIERDSATYVKNIQVGSTMLTGDEFATAMSIASPNFVITEVGDEVCITTKGIGHGIGLSLSGAKVMAESGKNYIEIIKYYYSNVEIEKQKEKRKICINDKKRDKNISYRTK